MRDFNNINENKPVSTIEYSVTGIASNGAHHCLGGYYSVSERGAIIQARKTYGDRYESFVAYKELNNC